MTAKTPKQLTLELAPKSRRPKRAPASKLRWICSRCDETLESWAAAERHVDQQHGGARLDCDMAILLGQTDRGAVA